MPARFPLLLFLLVFVVAGRAPGFLVLTLVFLAEGLGFEFVPVALEILEPGVKDKLVIHHVNARWEGDRGYQLTRWLVLEPALRS